jgi:hypothetical protein
MLALANFCACVVFAASRSQPSVLQVLARRDGANIRLGEVEAATSLLGSWYPVTVNSEIATSDEFVYGELEPEGLEEMFDRIAKSGAPFSKNDVFADLGSGIGQIALLVFLKAFPERAVGVEMQPSRHKLAVQAREHAFKALDAAGIKYDEAGLVYIEGDMLDSSHWADASVVYIGSTMFPEELSSALREELIAALQTGALVFSLKQLHGNHKDIAPLDVINVKTSWMPQGTRCFVYVRNLDAARLKELNAAIVDSNSVLEDCLSWGAQSGYFAKEELLQRFCSAFAWKWHERARFGQSRVDYDWVAAEL